ncbi:exonuclease SbcCD subunit D [Peribacillus sp. SCS-37]|uniref:metallophosphoesterase family protein n=1 Tax=Paraperibacillus esterisolvens TaxID=3115296 RepID=UPI00390621FC
MKEVTFIHTADLHLDSPFLGIRNMPGEVVHRLREATFTAFKKTVDAAILLKVDFMVIAGDLYDGENRSIRAQVRFRNEMERLAGHGIGAYIIHGNHDHLTGSWVKLHFPGNVHLFSGEYERKVFKSRAGAIVHLYGFSYPHRHVVDRMAVRYVKQAGADFHIALYHGSLEGSTGHGQYAPFSLGELLEKDMDYWALGHIHKRQELHEFPAVVYPGNIQGRHRKEEGVKGCYYVRMSENLIEKEFIETSDIIWDKLKLESAGDASFDSLLRLCEEGIQAGAKEGCGVLLSIEIEIGSGGRHTASFAADLLSVLQENPLDEDFIWPYELKLVEEAQASAAPSNPFLKELAGLKGGPETQDALDALFKHPHARKFLDELEEGELREIQDNSLNMVLSLLQGGLK